MTGTRCDAVSHYFFSLLLVLAILAILVAPAIAQQAPPPPAKPDPNTVTPKDPHNDPAITKTDEAVGKSKLEKETGTKNDRIFEVLPNYGFVAGAKALPPLTSGQKFRLATASVFDWAAFPFNGALAGIAQAKNDPETWGQGWGAYAKRYGASFADNSIGTYMTTAIFPSFLHEDPRYYQMRHGKFSRRAYYAANRLFVTRTDSGLTRFNFSESIGNASAAAISNIYHRGRSHRRAKRHDIWLSDSLRWLVQRIEGILAGHTAQSAAQGRHPVVPRGSRRFGEERNPG